VTDGPDWRVPSIRRHAEGYLYWDTPGGKLLAVEHNRYLGLAGQERIVLVDRTGRVFHYDVSEVRLLPAPRDKLGGTPPGEPG
jgi:hypothetical protein